MSNFTKPAYPGDRIIWVPELSEEASVKPQTVYKWLSNGTLPAVQLGGRRGCWESDFREISQPKKSA